MKYLNKRTWLGALLFLILVGEPTVGLHDGLFTLPGLIAIGGLYVVLFLLYEALVHRYKLNNGQILLLTFGIYAVVVTGLLHGEIADYVLHPHRAVITTAIRIQCSLFVPFAYYLLNKVTVRDPNRVLSVSNALIVCVVYVLVMSLSGKFGIPLVIKTFKDAPLLAIIFTGAGALSIAMALKPSKPKTVFKSKALTAWTWIMFVIAIIPSVPAFIVLLLVMPIVTLVYVLNPAWRNSPV